MASVAKSSGRRVEILAAAAEHRPLLDTFFKTVWPTDFSANTAAAEPRDRAEADGREPSPSTIAVQDGRIIGYLGTLPLRLWDGQREESTYWYKGFMVLPEFRNGPLGFGLVKDAANRLPTALVITVQPASWRLFKAAGLDHLGALENRLGLLRPGRIIRRLDVQAIGMDRLPFRAAAGLKAVQLLKLGVLAGGVIRGALVLWRLARGRASRRIATQIVNEIRAAEYDLLWSRVRQVVRFTQVRDGAYVQDRYDGGKRNGYSLIDARDRDDLVGFAALRHPRAEPDPRLAGLSVAVVADLFFDPKNRDAPLALLESSERVAKGLGADALVCSASHPAVINALAARGYLSIQPTLQFLVRLDGRDPGKLRDWWLLRADGNSDEGL